MLILKLCYTDASTFGTNLSNPLYASVVKNKAKKANKANKDREGNSKEGAGPEQSQ